MRTIALTYFLLLIPISCTNDNGTMSCPEEFPKKSIMPAIKVEQPLINGGPSGTLLSVSHEQSLSIGRVWPEAAPPGSFCSGVLIASNWVLTARHCASGEFFLFEIRKTATQDQNFFSSTEVWVNQKYDALLFKLNVEKLPIRPIGIIKQNIDASWIGTRAQLAGYGTRQNGLIAESLMFLVEPIIAISQTELILSGAGRSGACVGDSGSPLLARDNNGELAVAGILSSGSASCRDLDTYLRMDVLRDWIESRIGENSLPEEKCGDVTAIGFCRRGIAIWCDGEKVKGEYCDDDFTCGWSSLLGAYRCVLPEKDTCKGINDLGICENGVAKRCQLGQVEKSECEGCGLECAFETTSGKAVCLR